MHFGVELVQKFIRVLDIYPVGSVVELDSGKVGIVIEQGEADFFKTCGADNLRQTQTSLHTGERLRSWRKLQRAHTHGGVAAKISDRSYSVHVILRSGFVDFSLEKDHFSISA